MNNEVSRRLKAFICHASGDKEAAKALYDLLVSDGIDAWLDSEKLLPGQEWRFEIPKAVRSTDVIIICTSKYSLDKEGYVQKEIKLALDIADEKPDGTIFLIPARLEDCPVPERLANFQWVNLYEAHGYVRLLEALQLRAAKVVSTLKREDSFLPANPRVMEVLPFDLKIAEDFVKIPPGTFWMGSQADDVLAESSEKPQFEMKIPYSFRLACFPVTNYQFLVFLKQTGRENYFSIGSEFLNHPVVNVNWQVAMEYCKWLTKTFRQKLEQGYMFRLPSEAEWEMAARGPLPSRRRYPWGNHWSISDLSFCNSIEEGLNSTTSIGAYSPHGDSCYKIADMAGNVREWTRSAWGQSFAYPDFGYPYELSDDQESGELSESVLRVARGGSFSDPKNMVTCTYRHRHLPSDQKDNLGFRVVISPIILTVNSKRLNEKIIVPNLLDDLAKRIPLKKKKN